MRVASRPEFVIVTRRSGPWSKPRTVPKSTLPGDAPSFTERAIGAVGADSAFALPPATCAATSTRSACPTSAAAETYVLAAAPSIVTHAAPAASQRSQR